MGENPMGLIGKAGEASGNSGNKEIARGETQRYRKTYLSPSMAKKWE
jgi:hypothetical protein